MQIVSWGDNLHEMSEPIFLENNRNFINLSSAQLAHKVVKIKGRRLPCQKNVQLLEH